jgi:hypothetical protein
MNPNLPWAKGLEALVLKKLNEMGGRGTSRDVATATGFEMNLLCPRFTRLAGEGKIQDSGQRRSVGRGRPQVVWLVCDAPAQASRRDRPATVTDQDDAPAWFKRFGY